MNFVFEAKKRENTNIKNISKKHLREGLIPAVIYNYEENIPISIDRHLFEKELPKFKSNTVLTIKINGQEKKVFIRDYSFFLKSHRISHVDFYILSPEKKVKIKAPISLEGLPVGISKGGIIRRFCDNLLIECKSNEIPNKLSIDISKLDIKDYLYLKDIKNNFENINFLESEDKAIVSITITSKAAAQKAADEKK